MVNIIHCTHASQFSQSMNCFVIFSLGIEDDILDLLNLLVERSPQPPSNILIEIAFPASCHFILSSFEYHTVLRGSRLIRQFLSVAAQQVLGYRDGDDKSGLEYVLPVAVHLFDYEASPFYRRPFAMFRV